MIFAMLDCWGIIACFRAVFLLTNSVNIYAQAFYFYQKRDIIKESGFALAKFRGLRKVFKQKKKAQQRAAFRKKRFE